jgi:predicted metalloprotease with PDZ domain
MFHDTVIGINGELFNDGVKFSNLLEKYNAGDKVTLILVRKGRYKLVDVVLREFPIDLLRLYPENPKFPPQKERKIPKK